MTRINPAPRWPFAVSLVVLILDQISKRWFEQHYELYESRVVIPGFFNFTRTYNTGAAFSLFQDHPLPLTIFATLVFGLMVVFRDHLFLRSPAQQTAFGLIVGGVAGNLTDRIRLGHVVDFIHWYVGNAHWPIFNLADSLICVGIGLYLLSSRNAARPRGA